MRRNRISKFGAALALTLLISGCYGSTAAHKSAPGAEMDHQHMKTNTTTGDGSVPTMVEAAGSGPITVQLIDGKGAPVGKAVLTDSAGGVKVQVEASSLAPGKHGFHIHETGKCEAPDFKSAGGHFNPTGKKHGSLNPAGPHAGDLPNLVAGADGKASVEFTTHLVTLAKGHPNSLLKEGGTSLVIHEKADDYKTDPAGNSGARVACGVIM